MKNETWVLCPICKNKTRIKVLPETVLIGAFDKRAGIEDDRQPKQINQRRAGRIDAEPKSSRKGQLCVFFRLCNRRKVQ